MGEIEYPITATEPGNGSETARNKTTGPEDIAFRDPTPWLPLILLLPVLAFLACLLWLWPKIFVCR